MIYILSGTNRPNSRTLQVATHILNLYRACAEHVELMDLAQVPLHELTGKEYDHEPPAKIKAVIEKIDRADGLVIVTPEYNGSMPGALKYFIDQWSYPRTFEYRPLAFVGLGFRWGGLRPVEHLQQIFNYRNAYVFPERVFLTNISEVLVDGRIVDENVAQLLDKQARGFVKFIEALKTQNLHPNQMGH